MTKKPCMMTARLLLDNKIDVSKNAFRRFSLRSDVVLSLKSTEATYVGDDCSDLYKIQNKDSRTKPLSPPVHNSTMVDKERNHLQH